MTFPCMKIGFPCIEMRFVCRKKEMLPKKFRGENFMAEVMYSPTTHKDFLGEKSCQR